MGYEARPACGRPSAHRPREFAGAPEAIWAWRFGALEKTSGEGSSGELPGTRGGRGEGRHASVRSLFEQRLGSSGVQCPTNPGSGATRADDIPHARKLTRIPCCCGSGSKSLLHVRELQLSPALLHDAARLLQERALCLAPDGAFAWT